MLVNNFKKFAAEENEKLKDDYPGVQSVLKELIAKAETLKNVNTETDLLSNLVVFKSCCLCR